MLGAKEGAQRGCRDVWVYRRTWIQCTERGTCSKRSSDGNRAGGLVLSCNLPLLSLHLSAATPSRKLTGLGQQSINASWINKVAEVPVVYN